MRDFLKEHKQEESKPFTSWSCSKELPLIIMSVCSLDLPGLGPALADWPLSLSPCIPFPIHCQDVEDTVLIG